MSVAKKIVINTVSLYGKIIANIVATIFTTRIALDTLGTVDFGLFSLIAGVVVLLSFLNNALLGSTQRFLSISIGAKDDEKLALVFNTSVFLHVLFAIFIFVVFKVAQPFLFNGFLNIPIDKIETAISTYNIIILTTILTFITVPYNAVINAREDMWFFAITDILMSLFKLASVVVIVFITSDNLLSWYAFFIFLGTLITFLIKIVWCRRKYSEVKIEKEKLFHKGQIKEQFGFTSWNILVSFATVCRSQGIAVLLNVFYGPVINASYGVANQLNGLTTTFSSTLSSVFAPQIIQSKGAGNENRMNLIAAFSSKISFFLSAVIAIPILSQTQIILNLWLTEIPAYTIPFCNITIYMFLVMQLYPGLVRSLYAYGEIKWYQISITILLVFPLLIGYIGNNYFDCVPEFVLKVMLVAQILTLFVTIGFAKKLIHVDFISYSINNVFKPFLVFTIVLILSKYLTNLVREEHFEILFTVLGSNIIFSILYYCVVLNRKEKETFNLLIKKIISRSI